MNFDNIKKAVATSTEELKQHNTDKSIALAVRWEVFKEAPDYLKDAEGWTTEFDGLPDGLFGYDGPYYVQRRETIDVVQLIETLEEEREDHEELEGVDFDRVKEDILKRNLGSFTYDW